MKAKIRIVPSGTVTSPRGFQAGATAAGLKTARGSLDLGILFSETPCVAAGVFTANRIKAAPVLLSERKLRRGRAAAVVVNSGCANACTGEQGLSDAAAMAELTAKKIGVPVDDVLVASTGVIGQCLPMDKVRRGIKRIVLSAEGGHELARAMMTTDRVPKAIAVSPAGGRYTIGGVAKGSGMINPNLATLLCFLTTDAGVDIDFLRLALRKAVAVSFNMISVDDDTSTNDTVLVMANGLAGNKPIVAGSEAAEVFQQGLDQVCTHLAKAVARDGEGATKLIEVTVSGAVSETDARLAARTVISSPLVKTAVHGNDPNWGRIIAAVGRSGAKVVEAKVSLRIGDMPLMENGTPLPFVKEAAVMVLDKDEVSIFVDLHLGGASATAWGCDLSEEYVKINSQYTT